MMRCSALMLAALLGAASAAAPASAPLHFQTGDISLLSGAATLRTGTTLRYLDAAGAKRVIVDLWGNPPQAAEDVLGMIVPAGVPLEAAASWGVVLTESRDGHVSDADAAKTDYAALMRDMQAQTVQSNEERRKAGYDTVQLVGWADQPHYDAITHKMYWAKDLAFSGAEASGGGTATSHTLNYAVRILGRENVLELNAVAGMDQLPQVRQDMQGVLQQVSFNPGHRYEDFNASTDRMAEYGIAALVGGVAAKKMGLLAILLVVLKKGWIVIVGLLAGVGRLFRRGGQSG